MSYEVYFENKYKRWEVNNLEFRRLCEDITAELKWQLKPSKFEYSTCYDLSYGDYEISIRIDSQPNNTQVKNPRIEVSSSSLVFDGKEKTNFYNVLSKQELDSYTSKISVAIARGVTAIAKDINKRLIPQYEVIYAKALVKWREQRNQQQTKIANNQAVADLLYSRLSRDTDNRIYVNFSVGTHQPSAEVEIGSYIQEHINLKIRDLPKSLGIEILQLIDSYSSGSPYHEWLGKSQERVLDKLQDKYDFPVLPDIGFDWRGAYLQHLLDWQIYEQYLAALEKITGLENAENQS